uniref:Uncharacterized protein n=1 Tax=Clastoptera arizonana TaxID=38151 RepID=A0A1B6C5G7_9HEMI
MKILVAHFKKESIFSLYVFIYLVKCVQADFIESLKDAVLNAENTFGEAFSQLGKFSSQLNKVKNTWKDTVENECVYLCPNGFKPVRNKFYKPQSNGCGVNGFKIELDPLPSKPMTKCCNAHDICYGTCGSSKDTCDMEFKQCLYNICDNLGTVGNSLGCKTAAKMLYSGTNVLGCTFYKDAQKQSCYCLKEKEKLRGGEL